MPGFLTAVGAGRPCAFSVCRLPVQARPRSRHSRAGWATQSRFVRCSCRGESRMQERCIGSVEALVAALEFSMRELMDCPYAILGYSMGQASPWNYVAGFAAASCLSPSHCLSSARPALACRRGPRSRASPRAVRRRASPARWYIAGDPRELGTPRHISSCPARRLRPERIIRLQSTGALSLPTFAYAGESDALAPSVCRALVRRSRWPLPDAPLRRRPLFVQSSLEAVADSILRDLERWLVSPPSEVESSGT